MHFPVARWPYISLSL